MKKTVYFPGLNGIRAIAATIVLIFHTDQWSHYFNIKEIGFHKTEMHGYAVVMFFVLSGFLITYLLLTEKASTGTINFRKFYYRRILRIWPVYYMVLFAGTALLIAFNMWTQRPLGLIFLVHLFLVPNLFFMLGYKAELIGVLWSVGVEEQFYAFWPFLIKKFKNLFSFLLVFLGVFLAVKYALTVQTKVHIDFKSHLSMVPFDNMAIGGIAACIYFEQRSVLKFIYHPVTQVIAWLFLLVSIFYAPIHVPFLTPFDTNYHAIVYAIIILNVSTNPKTIITLENKVFNFLGKISYGIYAYHFIALFLVSFLVRSWVGSVPSFYLQHIITEISVLASTILLSHLSYKYYEAWFLKKKNKYEVIQSQNKPVEKTEDKSAKPESVCIERTIPSKNKAGI